MALEPGKYLATIDDFAITTSGQKKTPCLKVKFRIKDSGLSAYWDAWLTANTVDRVIKTLGDTQLLQTKNFNDLAQGSGLSKTQEVEIIVVNESYIDQAGSEKTRSKVEYVNQVGGATMKGKLAGAEAISALAGLNLDAAILSYEQQYGKKIESAPQTANFASEDVPF